MAYATVDHMITRFGATEMVRISTPADQEMDGVVSDVVQAALDDASAQIDSYVRRRYRTPMDVAPPEIVKVCCTMARFELTAGGDLTCSEDVRDRNKAAIAWLRDIADGKVRLELDEVEPTQEETAEVYIGGEAVFGRSGGGCW